MTIAYLLAKLDEREQYINEREEYIQELLDNIANSEAEKNSEINELIDVIREQSDKIKEQSEAITRIRIFNDEEAMIHSQKNIEKEKKQKDKFGHALLENRKKIIVVGATNLSIEVMKGIITKEYGFDMNDFVFETDYDKVVHSSGRIIESNKYQAIIFGCCPHSASGKGKWSSLIERCKNSSDGTLVVDARNTAGNLKVTKSSFRKALSEICGGFSDAA